jgi:hypothetical protein
MGLSRYWTNSVSDAHRMVFDDLVWAMNSVLDQGPATTPRNNPVSPEVLEQVPADHDMRCCARNSYDYLISTAPLKYS